MQKVAYYDMVESSDNAQYTVTVEGQECYYNSRDTEFETGSAETFQCYSEDRKNNDIHEDTDRATFCNTVTGFEDHNTLLSMTAVEYYTPYSEIPTGFVDDMEKRYVTSDGFQTKFYQTLHQAEIKYSPGGPLHDNQTWSKVGLTDLSDDYNAGEYTESWTIGNTGATNNDKIADSSFPGGFAGKCDPGQNWVYEGEPTGWTCSGEPQWRQVVMVPDVQPNQDGKEEIGMLIMPYNFQEKVSTEFPQNLNTYKQAWATFNDESEAPDSQTIEEVRVRCYPSDNGYTPSFKTENQGETFFSEIVQIDSPEKPVTVSGEVEMNGNETFSCNWAYKRQGDTGFELANIGKVIDLHEDYNSPPVDNFDEVRSYFAEQYSSVPSSSLLANGIKYNFP